MGVTLHCGARASQCRGLSCCRAQAPDTQAQQLWLTGPAAPRHVGSSQTRARTRVPCIGRQILNHCATREALLINLISNPKRLCILTGITFPQRVVGSGKDLNLQRTEAKSIFLLLHLAGILPPAMLVLILAELILLGLHCLPWRSSQHQERCVRDSFEARKPFQ